MPAVVVAIKQTIFGGHGPQGALVTGDIQYLLVGQRHRHILTDNFVEADIGANIDRSAEFAE